MEKFYPAEKNLFFSVFLIFILTIFTNTSVNAQVGIGTTKPHPSAVLDIHSENAGVLLPQISLKDLQDRNTINNPAEGLLIYNKQKNAQKHLNNSFYIWDGEKWDQIQSQRDADEINKRIDSLKSSFGNGSGESWNLKGNDLGYGGTSDKFLGSTTYAEVNFKVNNEPIGKFHPNGGVSLGRKSIIDDAQRSFALGEESDASGNQDAFAIGTKAKANTNRSVALGYNSETNQTNAFALGVNSKADGTSSYAIGNSSYASATDAFAIGTDAVASASASIAIGQNSKSSDVFASAFGVGAIASNQFSTSIGNEANSSGMHAMAVGDNSSAQGSNSISYGYKAISKGTNSIAIGSEAKATQQYSVAIGYGAQTKKQHTVVIGNAGYDANGSKNDWYKSKVGIGTYDPAATLDVDGSFKLTDGSQGAGKVLTSDANGNATWKDLNSGGGNSGSSGKVYADLYNNSSARLNNTGQPSVVKFGVNSLSKNIKIEQDGIQVSQGGIFKVNATITVNTEDDDAEDTVYEFYLAKWGNKIAGSSVYITIDSAIDDNEKYTVTLNKLLKLQQWEQVAVYGRQVNVGGHDRNASELSLVNGACSFTLEKIDEI
ncbi:hypothetical protein [Zunongwangia sp. HGR-M22]|uniref:hypothetical protein n=1 Tax=Zunongwangia sp. HGR-M22 TaxID=3015168 RepID=UPI0022DDD915|nr:hypothetical protein [Zunongwangia sp. HGR-M22]WBL27210.1 hypothetical protein PBT91_08020 [Zunongwangia sp. HGR-M22]